MDLTMEFRRCSMVGRVEVTSAQFRAKISCPCSNFDSKPSLNPIINFSYSLSFFPKSKDMLHLKKFHPPKQQSILLIRTFIEARVPWVRDRALDHAVEKEKHLLPFHNLKNFLINSSVSPTPLTTINASSSASRLPFRPIRFLRLFPHSFFETLLPDSPQPLFQPSNPLIQIHEEEKLVYNSCKAETADRLLRFLMLCPNHKLPIDIVNNLKWDLGLPDDFIKSLLPEYPDYFQIVEGGGCKGGFDLELVCYSKDLAVSEMESYAEKTGGYKKGMSLGFPLKFSTGFSMEKRVRKWVEEWQKLPYVSPYEDGSKLKKNSDLWEKWAVGMMHEVLSLTVSKKMTKETLQMVARYLGLNSGYRKMILHHPGIFYLSNKLRTQTVVLKEAYRRDLLWEKHPLMGIRYQYVHLMRKGKEESGKGKKKGKKSKRKDRRESDALEYDDGEADEEEEEEDEDEYSEISDIEDDESDEDESDDEGYDGNQENVKQGVKRVKVEMDGPRRNFNGRPIEPRRNFNGKPNERRTYGKGDSSRGNIRLNTQKKVSFI